MAIKAAINGFGRIGRPLFRRIIDNHPEIEVVAINDLNDKESLSHLLKYDSVYGIYQRKILPVEEGISVDEKVFKVFSESDPSKLKWGDLDVDIVFECTGHFTDIEGANKHILAGAKHVIISAPGKGVPSYILGINEENFNPQKDRVVDMGSCTTNCLAPIAKIIENELKIKKGFITTTHSYTNDQKILDLPHKDLRRARAAALNIIPTTTGAAKAISKVIPELEGKLDGIALRVPTPTVSILDFVVETEKKATTELLKEMFTKASGDFLTVEEKPLVSTDYVGNSHSAIIDIPLLKAEGDLVKVVAWYDNEYAYACRLAELGKYIAEKL